MTQHLVEWPRRPLSEVCTVSPRDSALAEDAPFVPMDSVKVGDRWPTYFERRGQRGGVRAQDNDVMFARITPCLENGKLAQVPLGAGRVGGSTEFIVVRPGPRIDPGFLYYWCMEPTVRADAASLMAGVTGRMRLGASDLAQFAIPVPPIEEQRRIVDILEDHLSRLNAAEGYVSRALARSRGLIDSALMADRTIRESHRVPLAGLLAESLRHGRSVPTADGGFPVLRLTAIRSGRIDLSARKTGAWTADEASPFLVQRGDFLVARGNGSLQLVGRGGLVIQDPDPVAYPDTAIRVRTQSDLIDSRFLALIWDSREVRTQIERGARTTAGIYKINQGDMRSILIPTPSLREQLELVARSSALVDSRDRLVGELRAAHLRVGKLRRTLLQAAFSGHLTGSVSDTDRAEESINV